jgi:hypothetical protein
VLAQCDVDLDQGDSLDNKVRHAQLAQYNFILGMSVCDVLCLSLLTATPVVVGINEMDAAKVSVRTRDNVVHGMVTHAFDLTRTRLKFEYTCSQARCC